MLLLYLAAPCAARADLGSHEGFSYSTSGDTITITGYAGPGGTVTIPHSIPGVSGSVRSLGESSFAGRSDLTSITIPDTVTSILGGAFAGCSGLTSLTIPGGVTTIGWYAFMNCSGLISVILPASVTSIATGVFAGCSGLATITLPPAVTSIESCAFAGCASLAAATIPDGVTTIGDWAFAGSSLAEVRLPATVNCIGAYAFAFNPSLSSFTFPPNVASVGDCALECCPSLITAYFQGNAPSSFGTGAFGSSAPGFSIFYPSTATGWANPWNGYPAYPHNYGLGALQVMLCPPEAVSAGAQWQVDGGEWQNCGATLCGLTLGTHCLAFRTVIGWTTPSTRNVTITPENTALVEGTYAPQTGSLQVTLTPPEAVSAGAQWQVDGGPWQQSGAMLPGLPAGSHTVAFSAVAGWTSPSSQEVTIGPNQTRTLSGAYSIDDSSDVPLPLWANASLGCLLCLIGLNVLARNRYQDRSTNG